MKLYCGIDLHSNNVLISIIDESDRVIAEQRLVNDLHLILSFFEPHRDALQGIVIESTYNWYWLVDGLMDEGYTVKLANTLAIQQYNGLKYTNDASDARFLAHLLRLDILPTGYIYPKETRSTRDLLRRRLLLVQQRTAQLLSLQSMIARHSGQRLSSLKVKQLGADDLSQWFVDVAALLAAQHAWQLLHSMTDQIRAIEAHVEQHCQSDSRYSLLMSVPGIGRILGMTILLELGTVERFPNAGHLASYARCVPSDKISNGKSKGKGNTKNGNRYLALAMMEAAHYATIWDESIKRFYHKRCKKVPRMVAKKTVANKLSRACYHMLQTGQPFSSQRAFG